MAKILLVEDDKSLREIYGVRLLAEGYDIISAGDGEEALAMAIKDRPDLILSDVMMPKISGFDMLDILRSTTETKDIKVVMMTALSSDDQRERGEKLGADRYLVKSQVGIEDVVRTVHEVLGDAPTTTQPNPAAAQATTPAAPATPPANPTNPQPTAQPAASPQAPAQPAPQPSPTPPTPQVQQPAPAPQPPASLPQPTAPFSTDRPANFGERVVQPPAPSDDNSADAISARIEQELSQALAEIPGTQPAQPQHQTPATAPQAAPQPQQAAPAAQPQAPSQPNQTSQQQSQTSPTTNP